MLLLSFPTSLSWLEDLKTLKTSDVHTLLSPQYCETIDTVVMRTLIGIDAACTVKVQPETSNPAGLKQTMSLHPTASSLSSACGAT